MASGLREKIFASKLYRLTLAGRTPPITAVAAPEPWLGRPEIGTEIAQGEFRLVGRTFPLGPRPWAVSLPSRRAQAALHGFGWLRHLRALNNAEAQAAGWAAIESWIETSDRCQPIPWRPDVLGERVAAWLTYADFATAGKTAAEVDAFRTSIGRQVRHLIRVAPRAVQHQGALAVAKGLIAAGIACDDRRWLISGMAALARAIENQVLPDGGHVQRSPSAHLNAIEELIAIRAMLGGAGIELPLLVQAAIDRMAPILRAFCHGDGRLALFNDSNEDDGARIAQVLAASGVRGKALASAPHSGFQRLAAARTLLILDTGGRPAPPFDGDAHAGALAFEMSVGRQRVVVNCGAHPDDSSEWREALRRTAAHSTVTVENRDSEDSRLGGARPGRDGPACQRSESDGDVVLKAQHRGYVAAVGLTHDRDVYLSAGGDDVRGKDVLNGRTGCRFDMRFHLHPDVKASLVEGGSRCLLRLPGGEGWQFHSAGATLGIEDSVYHGQPDQIRRTNQIVLSGTTDSDGATVKWAFRRDHP